MPVRRLVYQTTYVTNGFALVHGVMWWTSAVCRENGLNRFSHGRIGSWHERPRRESLRANEAVIQCKARFRLETETKRTSKK